MSWRSKTLLQFAADQACQLCLVQDGTVVAAHLNSVAHGKGTGIKCPDYFVAWLCHRCHHDIDANLPTARVARDRWMSAYLRTVEQWFLQELVTVKEKS